MSVDYAVVWAAVGAAGSVGAAGAAAWAARQSRQSAAEANAAAKTLADIERDRRRDELAPEFNITCAVRDAASEMADLRVALKPGRLERLDEVTVTILDEADREHWTRGLPDGVTQEEAEAFVWGGWEFNTGASAQVESNRTTIPHAYSLVTGKNWDLLSLTRTRPGRWMTGTSQDQWRKQYEGKPVRLLLTCRRDGHDPWMVLHEVEVRPPRGPLVS